jgi:Pectinacetylesterase
MKMTSGGRSALLSLAFAAFLPACSSSDAANVNQSDAGSSFEEARKELIDVGLNKYIGKAKPAAPETNGDVDIYKFDTADGPMCFHGAQFQVLVRKGSTDNLFIYLEGGGACWSGLCAATETADRTSIPSTGATIMSTDKTVSPVADWNLVYVPYCDGSVFSGDNDLPNESPPRYHRGLRNLTAAVDLAKSLFPDPKRIFLAGSSAGGYGTLSGTGIVRLEYEKNELMVFDDSGVVTTNPNDPSISAAQDADWKFRQFIPKSCTECISDQLTDIIAWSLKRDPSMRFSVFSSFGDAVIAGFFFKVPAPDFKALLLSVTGKIHDAYPDRFERFLADGTQHTTLGSLNTTVNGVTAGAFTRAMIDKTAAWTDTVQVVDGGM